MKCSLERTMRSTLIFAEIFMENKLLQHNKTILHFYTKLTNTMDNGAKSFASRILSPVAIIEVGSILPTTTKLL